MWIIALILAVVAAVLFFVSQQQAKRGQRLGSVQTYPCSDVVSLAASSALCEINGTAIPGPSGTLTSPITNQKCLWHRVEVTEEYWRRDSSQDGRSKARRVLSDTKSSESLGVQDDSGRVLVDVSEAHVDSPEKTHENYDRDNVSVTIEIGGFQSSDARIGTWTREWIIPVSTQLFVSGQAANGPQGLTIVKPTNGELFVSTKSEADLLKSASRNVAITRAAAGLAAGIAVVVFIVALL